MNLRELRRGGKTLKELQEADKLFQPIERLDDLIKDLRSLRKAEGNLKCRINNPFGAISTDFPGNESLLYIGNMATYILK